MAAQEFEPLIINVESAEQPFGPPDAYKDERLPPSAFFNANWKEFEERTHNHIPSKWDMQNMEDLSFQSDDTCVKSNNDTKQICVDNLKAIRNQPELRSLCPYNSSSLQKTQQVPLGATGGAAPAVSESKGAEASTTSTGASGATHTPTSERGIGSQPSPQDSSVSPADPVYHLNKDSKGWVCMWNNITECEEDTKKLEVIFKELGYKVTHMPKIDSYAQLVDYFENFQVAHDSHIVVFFFGFGCGENILIGTGEAECVSYRKFCEVIRAKKKDRKPVVVFTNTCLKSVGPNVVCHSNLDESVCDTFHLCIKVEGECRQGSLLTKALLLELQENREQEIYNMSNNIMYHIDKMEEGLGEGQHDLYEPEFRCYGIRKFFHFSYPPQDTPLEAPVNVQAIQKEHPHTGSSSQQKQQSKEIPAPKRPRRSPSPSGSSHGSQHQ